MVPFLCTLLLVKLAIVVSDTLDCNAIEYFDEYGIHQVFPVDACHFYWNTPKIYRCNDEGTDIIEYEYNSNDFDCSGNFVSGQSMKAYFNAKGIREGNYTMVCDKEACPWVIIRGYHYRDDSSCSYNGEQDIDDDIYILGYCDTDNVHYFHQCKDRKSVLYERLELDSDGTCSNDDSFIYNRYINESDCYYYYVNGSYYHDQHIICGVGSDYSYPSPPTPSPIDVANNDDFDLDCNGLVSYNDDYVADICHVEINYDDESVPIMYKCNHDGTDLFKYEYYPGDYDCSGDFVLFESMTADMDDGNYSIVCNKETCPWIKLRNYLVNDCSDEIDENLFEDELYIAYICTHHKFERYGECVDGVSVAENNYHWTSGKPCAYDELYSTNTISHGDCDEDTKWRGSHNIVHVICGEGSGDLIESIPSSTSTNSLQSNSFFILFVSIIFVQFEF